MEATLEERVGTLVSRVETLTPGAVTKPALVYFDIIGIAWPIRCLLHCQGIDYDYIKVSLAEWMFRTVDGRQPLKAAFSNGHLPLYVDSELTLNQSHLILRTLAQRAGLMGESEQEALDIESVLVQCYDALFHWNGIFPVNMRLNIADLTALHLG